jgi:hypothetical protein
MTYLDKTKITFHSGCAFSKEGIEKKPFATLTFNEITNRDLIDAVCELIKSKINAEGDFCNIKIQSEDWDC